MSELICGGCTACCEWGDDKAIRPRLQPFEYGRFRKEKINGEWKLAATKDGSCTYLGRSGCTIYGKRPMQCKIFDCRDLYANLKDRTFIKVAFIGKEKSDDNI